MIRGNSTPSEWIERRRGCGDLRWNHLVPDATRLSIRRDSEVREFQERYGGEQTAIVKLQNEPRTIYSSGAVFVAPEPSTYGRVFAAGSLVDGTYWAPPDDKIACLTLRILRVTAILQQFHEDFDALAASLNNAGPYFPWPSHRYGPATGDPVVDLERLNVLAMPFSQELRLLEAGFDSQPLVKRMLAREAAAEQERVARDAAQQRHESSQRARVVKASRSKAFANVPPRTKHAMSD